MLLGLGKIKPKRVKDFAYHKEKMLLCKQAEKGVPLQAEQYDWLEDTDEEINEQELEKHYSYMAKIQEVPTADTVETNDSNVILDSPDLCDDDIQNNQNDVESDDERIRLANLIDNLKLDVDENKKIQKQLKKANTTLAQELKECKTILAETSKTLGESNSVRDSKEIAKPITPPSETAFEEDNDPEQAQRDEDMQKNLALIAKYFKNIYKPTNNNLKTSSNSSNKNVDMTPRYKNDNQSGQFGNQRT
nr:hypothetical protein [Tanacetum cinerariifolium]